MFKFIKAVSDTVLDMTKAAHYDKPLIFIGATFREKLVSHHRAVDETDSCVGSKTVAHTKESGSLKSSFPLQGSLSEMLSYFLPNLLAV